MTWLQCSENPSKHLRLRKGTISNAVQHSPTILKAGMEGGCVRNRAEKSGDGAIPQTIHQDDYNGNICLTRPENGALGKAKGRTPHDVRDKAKPPLKPKPLLKRVHEVPAIPCCQNEVTSLCLGSSNSRPLGTSDDTCTKSKLMPLERSSTSFSTARSSERRWSDESWSDGSFSDSSWSDINSELSDGGDVIDNDVFHTTATEAGQIPDSLSPRDKVDFAANELLTTETAYVQRLHFLYKMVYSRLNQENEQHNFLPNEVLDEMFPDIRTIYELHHDILLPQLQQCMRNWNCERKLGDLMRKTVPSLKLYTGYIQNIEKALNLIDHWQERSPTFAAIIQEIQGMPECGQLAVRDQMLEPMIRLIRYPLLLENYLHHLPDDSPDRQNAQEALQQAITIVRYSNETVDRIKKSNRLLEIYQKLRGEDVDLISPTRDLVKEGPITEISASRGGRHSRYLILFNDLLLNCAMSPIGGYRVLAKMEVDGMEVKHGDNTKVPDTFVVYSKQKVLELLDEHSTEQNQSQGWFEVLGRVIQDFQNRKSSHQNELENHESNETSKLGMRAPRWIPDETSSSCMICDQIFTPFRRRHHCRACGMLICRDCSKKASLAYKNNKITRVCAKCHDVIISAEPETTKISPPQVTIHKKISVKVEQASDAAIPSCKLRLVAEELLGTERVYVQSLTFLYQAFYLRLQEGNRQKGFLPIEIPTYMFSNFGSILQFHQSLLQELESRMLDRNSEMKIGTLMKTYAPYLKLYTDYVKNINNVVNMMNHWQATSPAFTALLDDIHRKPECGNLPIQYHMREPIKRVSQYERFLIDYLTHLPDSALDRKDAEDALRRVTDVARHFKKAVKQNEEFHKLLDIYKKLFGVEMDFIRPTRTFVKEGPITKISVNSGEKQSRYLFLFSDCLLICTGPFAGVYTVRTELDVDGMEVHNTRVNGPSTFSVHGKHKLFELVDEHSPEDCAGWSEVLRQVIQDYQVMKRSLPSPSDCHTSTLTREELGKQKPLLISDDAAPKCISCQNTFTTFRRRHHCKACGMAICKGCSTKMSLEYTGLRKVRVCIQCQDTIGSAEQGTSQASVQVEVGPESVASRCKLQTTAEELLTTERLYVQHLRLLQEVVYSRIDEENWKGELPPFEALNEMIISIEMMHRFHENILLPDLESCMRIWDSEKRIGDVMKRNTPYLKLYKTYMKNVDAAISLIDYLLKNSSQLAAIVEEIYNMPECGHLTIYHYFLEPLHRVPRYESLLKEYLLHLPEDSPDREDAEDALTRLAKASSYIKRSMKKTETFITLLGLYQKLRGVGRDFIRPSRYLVREGPITKIAARSGEKQSRYIFLFNDLLLICTGPFVGAYLVRDQLDLQGLEVNDGSSICIPNSFLVSSKQRVIEFLDDKPTGDGDGLCWYEAFQQAKHGYRKGNESDYEPNASVEFKADDSCLLSSHLEMSEDNGKTWRRGWFTLHETFMYFFHAHKNMTAYKAHPVSELRAEILTDSERPRVFRLHNKSKNALFQADNYKTARLWVQLVEKQMSWDSQRLSSISNSSSNSNRSSNNSDHLSQTDSGYPADSSCESLVDLVNESIYANQSTLVNEKMHANQLYNDSMVIKLNGTYANSDDVSFA